MKTSNKGKDIIKKFEGCRLKAYKPNAAEKYYTIGWGHYGADVAPNMTISQERADELLSEDLKKFEKSVTATGLTLNQNQFDALVSFTYNCGAGNLAILIRNRTLNEIADAMLLYNKGADKKVMPGLVTRRKLERELFLSGMADYKPITPALIKDILDNKYGSGAVRKSTLEKAGYNYTEVQKKLNEILSYASEIQSVKKKTGEYWDIVVSRVE